MLVKRVASGRHVQPTRYSIAANAMGTTWRNEMNHDEFHRSPGEHGFGAPRTPRLLDRVRGTTFARRWALRRGDAPMEAVPTIEAQLKSLRPICTAQQHSNGAMCGAPAVAVAELHAIDECDLVGLSPDGDLVETLCQGCLCTIEWMIATYVGHVRAAASRCGIHPVCSTCGRPTGYLRSVFAVRPIGLGGLAL
jgi:hypothetical protein